ncbi:hypothetical protein AYI70_g6589 [Smittium culicis]|uniref:Extracellular membrane protein CFEM domain-containing protein n=1 Tax=Smittium culicis TaxID=133412 RepID=A0A1R1XP80_9FUNG|nr:hypothetical protein AYI70_g6589 [Smittium culicis]
MKFYQIVLAISVAIIAFVAADCDSEETLKQCIAYVTEYRASNCKGETDYECICAWDSQLATCFSVCQDDDSKKDLMNAALSNAKVSCDKFKAQSEKLRSNVTSTASSTASYAKPTSSVDGLIQSGRNNTRGGKVATELIQNSASQYIGNLMGVSACIVFSIIAVAI